MIKKLLTMVLVAGLVFTGNVFASTETTIKINKLEVKVNRSIGSEAETYRITLNDSLKEMEFRISDDNYFDLKRTESGFTVSGKYKGQQGDEFPIKENDVVSFDKEKIVFTELKAQAVTFEVTKGLSDAVFAKVFDFEGSFELNIKSTEERKLNVKRDGKDYIFSAMSEEIKKVYIEDGENYFNLVRGKNTFNVSGKYNGKILAGSISTSFKSGLLTYGDFELGLVLENDTIMITPNKAVIQRIKEEIEKERTTELTFEGGLLDITSYNNVENIIVSENIEDPKIRLPETIKKDLTIVSLKTKVVFPEGVKITRLEDGVMNLPKEVSVSIPKKTNTTTNVMLAIEVGGDNRVEFDKYVELIFPNMAGKKVGFFDGNDFKEITEVCSAFPSSDECKKNEEGDLVVLTKHFTTFAVYTETTSSSGGGESATYLTISNVYVSVNKDEATITFTTNNPALVILKYGNSQVSETQFKTSHSFKLTNLSVQKYNFKIEVRDKDNNLAEYEGSFDVLKEEGSSVGGGAGGPVPSFEGETSTQIKEQKTYNYGGVITTKPLNEMNREELVRLVLILILKSLLAKKGIIL
jgi:hypothetical protein